MMVHGIILLCGQDVSHVILPCLHSITIDKIHLAVNCSDPPQRPAAGTWEWNQEYVYETEIIYTCGPYGSFIDSDGQFYENQISRCEWNKTWTPEVLAECRGWFIKD